MPGKRIERGAFLLMGLALGACAASTRIVESWKAPGAEPPHFQKVLALAIVKNETLRHNAEDALQAHMRGVKAVQGYKVIELEELRDRERAEERLRQEGFDGVIVLRLAAAEQHLSWSSPPPPSQGGTYWGYYGPYPQDQLNANSVVRVEINVFSLAADKLLWTGVSKTLNPADAGELVAEIVAAAGQELRKQGLIS